MPWQLGLNTWTNQSEFFNIDPNHYFLDQNIPSMDTPLKGTKNKHEYKNLYKKSILKIKQ